MLVMLPILPTSGSRWSYVAQKTLQVASQSSPQGNILVWICGLIAQTHIRCADEQPKLRTHTHTKEHHICGLNMHAVWTDNAELDRSLVEGMYS